MYILYEMNTHSEVDRSNEEIDMITTIGEFYKENLGYRFMIVNYDKETTEPRLTAIRNIGDYETYIHEYNEKIKKEPIMQLKKEMFNIKNNKKV